MKIRDKNKLLLYFHDIFRIIIVVAVVIIIIIINLSIALIIFTDRYIDLTLIN